MMNVTYLTQTTTTSTQKINEQTPSTSSRPPFEPARPRHTLSVYSGLVPMSPNTTPIAATIRYNGVLERRGVTASFLPRRPPDSPRSVASGARRIGRASQPQRKRREHDDRSRKGERGQPARHRSRRGYCAGREPRRERVRRPARAQGADRAGGAALGVPALVTQPLSQVVARRVRQRVAEGEPVAAPAHHREHDVARLHQQRDAQAVERRVVVIVHRRAPPARPSVSRRALEPR